MGWVRPLYFGEQKASQVLATVLNSAVDMLGVNRPSLQRLEGAVLDENGNDVNFLASAPVLLVTVYSPCRVLHSSSLFCRNVERVTSLLQIFLQLGHVCASAASLQKMLDKNIWGPTKVVKDMNLKKKGK